MSTDTQTANKRIAKNTVFLYARMLFSMAVSLYTSRVVLKTLGVEDFGIYGVVGGVVSLFSFINTSLAGATSRFLTFELGKNDRDKLSDTFSTAFWEHAAIAFIIFIVAETIGLWFLRNKLVIPEDRYFAANVVYQLSIISMMITITQVPYSASIISHEKMNIFAYVEMLSVTLKLAIVYILRIGSMDKLILYSILVLTVHLLIAGIYRYICVRRFSECHIRTTFNHVIFKQMMKFSVWDLYGNLSVTARTQGVNMLINMFFGPVLNAAAAVAAQVQGAVMSFVSNVLTAVKPQIVKYYAVGEYHSMCKLVRNACKFNFLLLSLISVPCIVELHFILDIWLDEVPDFAVLFCSYTLIFNFFANLSTVLVSGIHAAGHTFRPSFINGTLYIAVIPITYISYKCGAAPWSPYLFNVCAVVLGMLSNAVTLHKYVGEFSITSFICKDLPVLLLILAVSMLLGLSTHLFLDEGWPRFLLSATLSALFVLITGWLFVLPDSIKKMLIGKLCARKN